MFFDQIYSGLSHAVNSDERIASADLGGGWALVRSGSRCGIAMATDGETVPPMLEGAFEGKALREAASAVGSWNFREASLALAAVNCELNTSERITAFGAGCDHDTHYTNGLDFKGKTVGFIGHLKGSDTLHRDAKRVIIFERDPKPGDYPDSAEEYLLPECDIVLITGSAIINKTLPRLIELCKDAYTVLTGPSVPLWPGFLDMGIDMIAGMAVTDEASAVECVRQSVRRSPYRWGPAFRLTRQRL